MLKLFRRVEPGRQPRRRAHRLAHRRGRPGAGVCGRARVPARPGAGHRAIGILQAFVPNEGDAWTYTLDHLEHFLERVLALPPDEVPPALPSSDPVDADGSGRAASGGDAHQHLPRVGPAARAAHGRHASRAGGQQRPRIRPRGLHAVLSALAVPVDAQPDRAGVRRAAGAPHGAARRPARPRATAARPTARGRRALPRHRHHEGQRVTDAAPRRLPPGPGALDGPRLRRARLRGRADAAAVDTAAETLAAA